MTANPFYAARSRRRLMPFHGDSNRVVTIGPATLYLGDCFDIMPTLDPVEAVVTDPPYGIGFKYRSCDDAPAEYDGMMCRLVPMEGDDYREMLRQRRGSRFSS